MEGLIQLAPFHEETVGCHLLDNGRQPPQSQAALISTCDHSAAKLHHNALGMLHLAAVGQRAPLRARERN